MFIYWELNVFGSHNCIKHQKQENVSVWYNIHILNSIYLDPDCYKLRSICDRYRKEKRKGKTRPRLSKTKAKGFGFTSFPSY